MMDAPPQWKKRCTPTAAYWPCPVVSYGHGDSFEEQHREHNKHHNQDTPLSPGGDTDAYTSEPEDDKQSECTFDSDSEATQEYIPSDDDSEPTQVHIPSEGLAASA